MDYLQKTKYNMNFYRSNDTFLLFYAIIIYDFFIKIDIFHHKYIPTY